MSIEQNKGTALTFLKNFEHPDAKAYEPIIADESSSR